MRFCFVLYNKAVYACFYKHVVRVGVINITKYVTLCRDHLLQQHGAAGAWARHPKIARLCGPYHKQIYAWLPFPGWGWWQLVKSILLRMDGVVGPTYAAVMIFTKGHALLRAGAVIRI